MSIESIYQTLEIGSLQEKHTALFNLQNLAATQETNFDVNRLIRCLLQDDSEIVYKLYSLLASLVLHNTKNRQELLRTSAVYDIACKIFINGSNKKIYGVLNLFAAILQSDDMELLSENYNFDIKMLMRISGCLEQMCKLFLHSNVYNKSWKILCLCLAESCFDSIPNKTFCSHILLKCLRELMSEFKLEVVMLTRALIENFLPNQEKLIQLNGLECFTRNLLDKPEGIELLCVALYDCDMAIDKANQSNLGNLILDIKSQAPVNSKIAKWCSVALWRLNIKLKPDERSVFSIESSNKMNVLPSREEKLDVTSYSKLPETSCKPFVSLFGREIENLSHISKFDAIVNDKDSFSASQKHSIFDTSFIFPDNDKKSNSKILNDDMSIACKKNNTKHCNDNYPHSIFRMEKRVPLFDKENYCEMDNVAVSGDKNTVLGISGYSEFHPRYCSSPIRHGRNEDKSRRKNASYVIPESTRKRGYGFFKKLNDITNENSSKYSKDKNVEDVDESFHEIDNDVTLTACDDNPSTTLKVRELAKYIMDLEEESKKANPDEDVSFIHKLSCDNDKKLRVESIPRNGKPLLYDFTSPLNQQTQESSNGRYTNIRTYFNKKIKNKNNTIDKECEKDISLSIKGESCVNVSKSLNMEDTISLMSGGKLESVLSLLKVGISLYGCNFQKIAQVMWPNDGNISPVMLYKLFKTHIVNHSKYSK